MYYEINVAKDGKHFFATHKRSITTDWQLQDAVIIFAKKFPQSEGYDISISLDEESRAIVDYDEVLKEAQDEREHVARND